MPELSGVLVDVSKEDGAVPELTGVFIDDCVLVLFVPKLDVVDWEDSEVADAGIELIGVLLDDGRVIEAVPELERRYGAVPVLD